MLSIVALSMACSGVRGENFTYVPHTKFGANWGGPHARGGVGCRSFPIETLGDGCSLAASEYILHYYVLPHYYEYTTNILLNTTSLQVGLRDLAQVSEEHVGPVQLARTWLKADSQCSQYCQYSSIQRKNLVGSARTAMFKAG